MDDVAQFVFADLPDSYAARTGRPERVGVIGIAVFGEAARMPRYYPAPAAAPPPVAQGSARREMRSSADAAVAESAVTQQLGTGHGEREWAPTSRTGFERASRTPLHVEELRYDRYRALVARGVSPARDWRPVAEPRPQAFPGGFVADPR